MYVDITLVVLGVISLLTGLVGCVIPMLPGPPVAFIGMLLLHFTDFAEFSWVKLLIWLILVVIVQALDYVVPMLGTKATGGSKWGNWFCVIGTIVGLFFLPWGIILGPFLGAVIGELISGHSPKQAVVSGLGSLAGFLFGTAIKLLLCIYFCVEFVVALIW